MSTGKIKLSVQITPYYIDLELFYDYGRIRNFLSFTKQLPVKQMKVHEPEGPVFLVASLLV